MDRDQYERDLKERQERHLREIREQGRYWKPCLHDQCSQCHGTGLTKFGVCVHALHCDCPKCQPYSFTCTNTGPIYTTK